MVKFRQAGYCNLKLVLLYLVIYGHWIEPRIGTDRGLYIQYWWIYLLHMPLFAFLSGLFLRSREDCLRQIKRWFPVYVVLQLSLVIFSGGSIRMLQPFWHLWYLLSLCAWAGAGWLLLRVCPGGRNALRIFLVAVLAGAVAGYVPFLDRTLSGSRTVAFFPFFWLGLVCRQEFPWRQYRLAGVAALWAVVGAAALWGNKIPVTFLYHAQPYERCNNGFLLRLLCYVMSGLFGFFVLTLVPDKRFPWTKVGADTMPGYLLHAPLVGFLREFEMHGLFGALLSGGLLYIIYKGTQWYRPLYGVRYCTLGERRDRLWPGYKRFMSNMQKQYTDSC